VNPPATRQGWLVNLVALLSIFCFIQILPLDAEVQPFGAVAAAVLLALYATPLRGPAVLYFAALSVGLALTLAKYALAGQPQLPATFSTFFAIGAPVLVFAALLGQTERLSPPMVLACIGVWLFVGVAQTFLPQLQQALGLDRVLTRLISRYAEEALTDQNRGASLLAPEPSYAAHIVFLFFVALLCFRRTGRLGRPAAAAGFAAVAVLAFANRSGTLAMVLFAFLACYGVAYALARPGVKSFALIAGALLAPIGAIFLVPPDAAEEFRAAVVLAAFLEDLWRGQLDIVAFTTGFGSIRTISVLTAVHSVLAGKVLGDGLGSWSYRFIDELFALGVNPWELFFFYSKGALVDIKPYSHVAILAFDMGVAGVLLDLALLRRAFALGGPLKQLLADPLAAAIVAVSVIAIVGNTLVSLPAYWITLALGLDLARHGALHDRH
jgi:hypothetical protein